MVHIHSIVVDNGTNYSMVKVDSGGKKANDLSIVKWLRKQTRGSKINELQWIQAQLTGLHPPWSTCHCPRCYQPLGRLPSTTVMNYEFDHLVGAVAAFDGPMII